MRFEETSISAVASGAAALRRSGQEDAAVELEALVRRHRVGLLKHRALLGAQGIEV